MRKVLASLACAALLFGAVACEADDDCYDSRHPKTSPTSKHKTPKTKTYKAPKAKTGGKRR